MMRRIGLVAALGALGISVAALGADSQNEAQKVTAALHARLPNTAVTALDCTKAGGFCEVVAGKSLFYVDHSARFLFIGRVYDMETRQDLTAARLLELNPGLLLGGAPNAGGKEESEETPVSGVTQAGLGRGGAVPPGAGAVGTQRRVDLGKLGPAGAIVWGKPGGVPLTIFTDFHCGYCRALVTQLEQMNVRVIERPISTLGSRDIANRVYCARDKEAAVKAAYEGRPLPAANCDTAGLDANERFAQVNGFSGTPVLVRKDGAVLEGFRPREILEAWLKEAK